jgi:thiol-disulfide isomerase/thioredoxin
MHKRRTQRKQQKKQKKDANTMRASNNQDANTIVCKIYANWCGHCQTLKPVWAELKNVLSANKNITMMEIEESEMKEKMGTLKNICKKDIDVNGFPTIVKICNKKVEYYQGERSVEALRAWISKPTTKTIQGGKKNTRRNKTHRK